MASPIEGERQGVPVPQRKRYSSTFGYRYTGSVGSTTSIPASTSGASAGAPDSGSGGGGSEHGNVIAFGGRGTPASATSTDRSLGPTQDRRIKVCVFMSRPVVVGDWKPSVFDSGPSLLEWCCSQLLLS